ncbi:MAG: hypothetical protein VXB01_09345 [Opitutae bacterium]
MSDTEPETTEASPDETSRERFKLSQRLRLTQRSKAKAAYKPLGFSQATFTPPSPRENSHQTPEES